MWYAMNKSCLGYIITVQRKKMALIVQPDYRVDISNTGLECLIHTVNPRHRHSILRPPHGYFIHFINIDHVFFFI